MYDSVQYALSRLNETIIRDDKGVPCTVVDGSKFRGEIYLELVDLKEGNRKSVAISKCDLKSPNLGFYFNNRHGSGYLARKPMRQWRQGIRLRNITSLYGLPLQGVTNSNLSDCIQGIYPTKRKALGRCESMLVPVSRHLALRDDGLHYKHLGQVGTFSDKLNSFNLNDGYEFLQRVIEKELADVR